MAAIDASDRLPRAGETVLACRHIALGDGAGAHWYRHTEPTEATAPDGRTFSFRFLMACQACHARVLKGADAMALMSADRVWTDYDVLMTPEPKAGT